MPRRTPLRPTPPASRPIVIIGAGGIVRQAHLPAYKKANLSVSGIYDIQKSSARETAARWNIDHIYESLDEAAAEPRAVFDVAVPADQILQILPALPNGAAVLIQKPLGRDFAETKKILAICSKKKLTAAVNFQLRFSPAMAALRAAVERGALGEIVDFEVRVNTYTPWARWDFLKGIPRLEILYHSIHYIDIARALLGEPSGVHAAALPHPASKGYADVRSSILLNYPKTRCAIYTNHNHPAGSPHAASILKIEGTRGAAVARLGVNLNYPTGLPDTLEMSAGGGRWRPVALGGSWFPDAFAGPMLNLQHYAEGEDRILETRVGDAAKTMAVVEACYKSARARGTQIPKI